MSFVKRFLGVSDCRAVVADLLDVPTPRFRGYETSISFQDFIQGRLSALYFRRENSFIRRDRRQKNARVGKRLKHTIVTREAGRSEEHTSELQSLRRISYAVYCL